MIVKMKMGYLKPNSNYQLKQEVMRCGLTPKDIRLLRKKDTGKKFFFLLFWLCNSVS